MIDRIIGVCVGFLGAFLASVFFLLVCSCGGPDPSVPVEAPVIQPDSGPGLEAHRVAACDLTRCTLAVAPSSADVPLTQYQLFTVTLSCPGRAPVTLQQGVMVTAVPVTVTPL